MGNRPEIRNGQLKIILPTYRGSSRMAIHAVYPRRAIHAGQGRRVPGISRQHFGPEPYWDRNLDIGAKPAAVKAPARAAKPAAKRAGTRVTRARTHVAIRPALPIRCGEPRAWRGIRAGPSRRSFRHLPRRSDAPSVGFAAARLIEAAGCTVVVPLADLLWPTAYNSGDRTRPRCLRCKPCAPSPIATTSSFPPAHAPPCTRCITRASSPPAHRKSAAMSKPLPPKSTNSARFSRLFAAERYPRRYTGRVTYHDACSGLRELGIKSSHTPRLGKNAGPRTRRDARSRACCGFGGLFAEKVC